MVAGSSISLLLGSLSMAQASELAFPVNKSITVGLSQEPAIKNGDNQFYEIVYTINPTLPADISDFQLIREDQTLKLQKTLAGYRIEEPIKLEDKVLLSWGSRGQFSPVAIMLRNPLEIGAVSFAFNSSKLSPEAKQVIKSVSQAIATSGLRGVYVVGNADKPGSDLTNMSLSQKRAKRVLSSLSKDLAKLSITDAKISKFVNVAHKSLAAVIN